ncbi:hypothetical protein P154DRAFT_565493 [Amniculicola lignicola CBS 123094]|uniref:Protein kinase domain-containing protein n=1 Tax=Amniculicola lignicola CBS 123094 TaxID=1392246 RepID=A0A6A5W974_9PLEO|nr:hypothetical protein P154DRAFT_565493 [Amniculicola lignicola CBS 123094]
MVGKDTGIMRNFTTRLNGVWRRKTVCHWQCPDQECHCKLHYTDFEQMETWMEEKPDGKLTNAGHLLLALGVGAFPPFLADYVLDGTKRCVRVFCILLELEQGDLIDYFYRANIVDKHLHYPLQERFDDLRAEFLRKRPEDGPDRIDRLIIDFKAATKAFYPVTLELGMDDNFEGGRYILPYCQYRRVNGKGGTASVFEASVQQCRITHQGLKEALARSVHEVENFGSCFKIAVKSYSKNNKDLFEWEKGAFKAMKNDGDKHIVRYLGCYQFDDGDRKTYNLLLEFGEMDFDEFCADLSNVPPVITDEIIRFWKSIFKIADAIKEVHAVSLWTGRSHRTYDGWHADIKPDNILRVNGRFKLADFGFAKFVETSNNVDRPPEQVLEGGTDSFGAPEFSRAIRAKTQTPVTQKIDTWSYGCVLSIAATWVVLGFQGIIQYRFLRKRARSNAKFAGTKACDLFHDGKDVLPEIKHWHNYLRDHIRKADTATSRVLDLIEGKMLTKNPQDRYTFTVLCEELGSQIKIAEERYGAMMRTEFVRGIPDNSVMAALWEIETLARQSAASSQSHTMSASSNIQDLGAIGLPLNLSDRQSKRVRGDAHIRQPRFAITPFRDELAREKLDALILWEPIDGASSIARVPEVSRPNPLSESPTEEDFGDRSWPDGADDRMDAHQDIKHRDSVLHSPLLPVLEAGPSEAFKPGLKSADKSNNRGPRCGFTEGPSHLPLRPTSATNSPPVNIPDAFHIGRDTNPNASGAAGGNYLPRLTTHPPEDSKGFPGRLVAATPPGWHEDWKPVLEPVDIKGKTPQRNIPDGGPSDDSDVVDRFRNNGTGSELVADPTSYRQPGDQFAHSSSQQPPPIQSNGNVSSVAVAHPFVEIPSSVWDLPWHICKIRKGLDADLPKGTTERWLAPLIGRLSKDSRKSSFYQDLKFFIDKRDMILVMDNTSHMQRYWGIVTFVAETLAMQLAGLDDDGIDARFTVRGKEFNTSKLKGIKGLKTFHKLLVQAHPIGVGDGHLDTATDMSQTLEAIFGEYRASSKKETTLIIFTDGDWDGTRLEKLYGHITKFMQHIKSEDFPSRHFTLTFIRFGDDPEAIQTLQYLDDTFHEEKEIEYGPPLALTYSAQLTSLKGHHRRMHVEGQRGENALGKCYG